MITERPATPGFKSLADLQEHHAALVKEVGKHILEPANLERIGQFVRKAVASGTVLDATADRTAAQSLITFWNTRLASAIRSVDKKGTLPALVPEFEDTLLAEFRSDALYTTVIAPLDKWMNQQSDEDQRLARRLVLRLVSLREDGEFDVLPGATGVCEDLVPQDRAKKVLAELVRLGAVRSTRNPSGYEEFALRSAELLEHWPRLKEWMAERKRFRQKATEWAKRRAEKAEDLTNQSFLRRAEKALRVAVHKAGAWIVARWRALLALVKIRRDSEGFLTEDEYEEAECYRDKNAVEFRVVYLKRQLDKERDERRQVIAFALAAAVVVVSVLLVYARIQRNMAEEAEKQAKIQRNIAVEAQGQAEFQRSLAVEAQEQTEQAKKNEEEEKKRANLKIAAWALERGAQLETDDRDTSGAYICYADAWSKFKDNASVLEPKERDRRRASYLLRLGVARQQLPFLSGIAYHKHSGDQGGASARTPDGRFLLTVGADKDDGPTTVRLWRWPDEPEGAGWNETELTLEQSTPAQAFVQAGAYLSPDGRFAVVSGVTKGDRAAHYLWDIPEQKPARLIHVLEHCQGQLPDAGFSPDGKFFAVVSQPGHSKGEIMLWRCDSWNAPISLRVPDGIGVLGRLAFCPIPRSGTNLLAVTVQPVAAMPDKPSVICLEWSLQEPLAEAVPRQFAPKVGLYPRAPGEVDSFVAYKPGGRELLVAHSRPNNSRAEIWLFSVERDQATQDTVYSVPASPLPCAGPVLHAAFSPRQSDDRFVVASADGSAAVWSKSVNSYPPTRTLKHRAQVFRVDLSPDGQYLVTASRDKRALIWDVDSGQLAHPSLHHIGSVTDAGFIDNGRCVVTSCRDTTYRWDLDRDESRPMSLGAMRELRTTSADEQGLLVVTAGTPVIGPGEVGPSGWARVWDAVTGDPRSPELLHPSPIRHTAITGAGPGLVSTVGMDGEVRVWDINGYRPLWSDKPGEGQALYTSFGHTADAIYLLALIREDRSAVPLLARIYRELQCCCVHVSGAAA
jgi:WD40 repeat protein